MYINRSRSQFWTDIAAVAVFFTLGTSLLIFLPIGLLFHVPIVKALPIIALMSVQFSLYVGIPAWPIARDVPMHHGDARARIVDAFTQAQYRLAEEDATRMAFVTLSRSGVMNLNVFVEYDSVNAKITGNWPTVQKVRKLLRQ